MEPFAQDFATTPQTIDSLLLSQIPDGKRLFHYTDSRGLVSMAQHQQVWMTNMHYQNDGEEYYYTFNLLKDILREEYPNLLTEEALEKIGNTASGTFTFSLTEDDDSLSQWRGYCPNGGYAISFDSQHLNKVIERDNVKIAECIYDKARQRKLIIDNIIKITPEAYAADTNPLEGSATGVGHIENWLDSWGIIQALNDLAPILKHPSFSREKEWRLIKTLDSDTRGAFGVSALSDIAKRNRLSLRNDIKIRDSKNKLIPYIETSLKYNETPIRFEEVVISPTPHKVRELEACKILINGYDSDYMYMPAVRNSAIPYVNW